MDSILTCVSEKNKKWASTLKPSDIAHLLDSLALMPTILSSFPNPESVINENVEYSDKPALKGLEGEEEFEKMCNNMLCNQFTVINTAKKSKSGDFFIEWISPKTSRIYKFLIDIKNYKSTVPFKEVDKFYRDLELHSSLNGAILISLHSKIVGHKSVFEYEEKFVNSNMLPIAYICSNDPNVISEIIKFMCNLSEIKKICNVKMSSSEKIMRCIKDLESSIDLFSRSRGNLQDIKLMLEKQFNKIFIDLLSVEHVFKSKIEIITQTLIDEQYNEGEYEGECKSESQNILHELPIKKDEFEKKDIIVDLKKGCLNYKSNEEIDSMIRHIWSYEDWELVKIENDKVKIARNKDDTMLVFKFNKTGGTSFTIYGSKIDLPKNVEKVNKNEYSSKLNTNSYKILCSIIRIRI
jgi:hypothetical protein